MGHRSRPEKAPVPARRPRVLIAEPHDGFRRALGAYLEAQFEIVAVVASEVALDECARAGLPDVVVCDLSLLSSVRRWARRERYPPEIGIVGLALHDVPIPAQQVAGLVGGVATRRMYDRESRNVVSVSADSGNEPPSSVGTPKLASVSSHSE